MKKFAVLTALAVSLCSIFAVGCKSNGIKSDGTVLIAASTSPHAEILEFAKPILEADYGIKIEVKIFTEYGLFNPAVSDGSVYANYFQHTPFLDDYNANVSDANKLVSAGKIHFEPLGLYKGGKNNADGSRSFGVPNDATNRARALALLADNGYIGWTDAAHNKGLTAIVSDFELKGNKIVEVAAEQLARSLPDVDNAVINGNYALEGGVSSDKLVASESTKSEACSVFANIIAVRSDCADSTITNALVSVLTSQKVKDYITNTYSGAVVPV